MPSRARLFAGLIFLIASATLVLRVVLRAEETGSIFEAISYLSQFFTILTNLFILIMMGAVAFGARVNPHLALALTLAIVGVGLVYHVALAHLRELSGITLLADHGVHTFVPLLSLIWWFWFAPKKPLRMSNLATWIVWPVTYCVYILLRANGSGFYPYPFLNLPEIGVSNLMINIAILSIAFIVIGLVLTGVSSLINRLKLS